MNREPSFFDDGRLAGVGLLLCVLSAACTLLVVIGLCLALLRPHPGPMGQALSIECQRTGWQAEGCEWPEPARIWPPSGR